MAFLDTHASSTWAAGSSSARWSRARLQVRVSSTVAPAWESDGTFRIRNLVPHPPKKHYLSQAGPLEMLFFH